MPRQEVQRTYLEMTSPDALRPVARVDPVLRLDRAEDCPASFYRFLYVEVGRGYHWVDRLGWSDAEIASHLATPGVSLFVLYRRGVPAGYFELRRSEDGAVEIAYFGLLPEQRGRGLGKHLLTSAVEQAWAEGASRVWLHTCSLDDPAAIPNYLARGFRAYRTETYWTDTG